MKNIHILLVLAAMLCGQSLWAQEKISDAIEIDKTVHNFGDILLDSGPVSCSFTLTNKGSKPAVIYNVTSSCGCTNVNWTKEPLMPGKTGKISVTYSNDEGAYPFDKSLTVYLSDVKKPVILKVRGVSVAKKKPLSESYPVHFGVLGMKEKELTCGNLEQEGWRSNAVMVANISDKPITVDFTGVSPNLDIKISPNPIPAQSTAEMTFTITASRDLWGKNFYWASPRVNGTAVKTSEGDSKIKIWAFTKENFAGMSDSEKAKAARPMFEESTYSFGKIKRGSVVNAEFKFKNEGQTDFKVYAVNSDGDISYGDFPVVKAGSNGTFKVALNTSTLPVGEALVIVTLTTNSPLRPIVNLFIAGWIE